MTVVGNQAARARRWSSWHQTSAPTYHRRPLLTLADTPSETPYPPATHNPETEPHAGCAATDVYQPSPDDEGPRDPHLTGEPRAPAIIV